MRISMKLQQNKVKKLGIISVLSSIVIEGFRTLFFSQILKRKKHKSNFKQTFKKVRTLKNQLSTKNVPGGGRFIINWATNKTLKNFLYPYGSD